MSSNISKPSVDHTLSVSFPVFDIQFDDLKGNKGSIYAKLKQKGKITLKVEGKPKDNTENTYRIDLSDSEDFHPNLSGIFECGFYTDKGCKNKISDKTILLENDRLQNIATSQQTVAESIDGGLDVNVIQSKYPKTPLFRLFYNIKTGTENLEFTAYEEFINKVLFDNFDGGEQNPVFDNTQKSPVHLFPMRDSDIYHVVKAATEAFLMLNAGTKIQHQKIDDLDLVDKAKDRGIFFNDGGSFADSKGVYLGNGSQNSKLYLAALYLIKEKLGASIGSSFVDARIEAFKKSKAPAFDLDPKDFYVIKHRLQFPLFIELIWSYWHEESMLVQTISAICRRFQNIRSSGKSDPLADMEITHLLPLNNVLWGYIQDEQNRLSVKRRAYEYDHHYGISLHGKAVPKLNSADSRVKFIGAFHNLLHQASTYFKESANKLVAPDSFPLLNALREVNFIIAEGMHNQYGDLPWTARTEMLMQQWILSRDEFRNFLPGRVAVPYPETWMERVAAMNKLQGWTDTSPIDFSRLAVFGERLLLSIRFGLWNENEVDEKTAGLWAEFFRPEIQGYIHSYKAATGADLSAAVVGTQIDSRPPSYHLANRQRQQQNGKATKAGLNGTPVNGRVVNKEWY